jgi:hypothetical protein
MPISPMAIGFCDKVIQISGIFKTHFEENFGACLNSLTGTRWFIRPASAADLKFLQQLQQNRLGTSNRKAALESLSC